MRSLLFPCFLALLLLGSACDATLPETAMENPDEVMRGDTTVLFAGDFVDKGGQTTRGAFRIEQTTDGRRLVLTEAFRTDGAPDLHVVLSPLTVAEAGNTNATAGSAIVAPLKARAGVQLYPLADTLDLERYRSVLIHCVQFRHLFGAAPLVRR